MHVNNLHYPFALSNAGKKNVWTTVLFLSAIMHRNSLTWIWLHSGAGKKGTKLDETAENSFVQDISMTS